LGPGSPAFKYGLQLKGGARDFFGDTQGESVLNRMQRPISEYRPGSACTAYRTLLAGEKRRQQSTLAAETVAATQLGADTSAARLAAKLNKQPRTGSDSRDPQFPAGTVDQLMQALGLGEGGHFSLAAPPEVVAGTFGNRRIELCSVNVPLRFWDASRTAALGSTAALRRAVEGTSRAMLRRIFNVWRGIAPILSDLDLQRAKSERLKKEFVALERAREAAQTEWQQQMKQEEVQFFAMQAAVGQRIQTREEDLQKALQAVKEATQATLDEWRAIENKKQAVLSNALQQARARSERLAKVQMPCSRLKIIAKAPRSVTPCTIPQEKALQEAVARAAAQFHVKPEDVVNIKANRGAVRFEVRLLSDEASAPAVREVLEAALRDREPAGLRAALFFAGATEAAQVEIQIEWPLERVRVALVDRFPDYSELSLEQLRRVIPAVMESYAMHNAALRRVATDADLEQMRNLGSLARFQGQLLQREEGRARSLLQDAMEQGARDLETVIMDAERAQAHLKELLAPGSTWAKRRFPYPEFAYDAQDRVCSPGAAGLVPCEEHVDPGVMATEQVVQMAQIRQRPDEDELPVQRIIDMSRVYLIFDSAADLLHGLYRLHQGLDIQWLENRFQSPSCVGHCDISLGVGLNVSPRRHISELRLLLREVQTVSQGMGQRQKETIRTVLAEDCGIAEDHLEIAQEVVLWSLDSTEGRAILQAVTELGRVARSVMKHACPCEEALDLVKEVAKWARREGAPEELVKEVLRAVREELQQKGDDQQKRLEAVKTEEAQKIAALRRDHVEGVEALKREQAMLQEERLASLLCKFEREKCIRDDPTVQAATSRVAAAASAATLQSPVRCADRMSRSDALPRQRDHDDIVMFVDDDRGPSLAGALMSQTLATEDSLQISVTAPLPGQGGAASSSATSAASPVPPPPRREEQQPELERRLQDALAELEAQRARVAALEQEVASKDARLAAFEHQAKVAAAKDGGPDASPQRLQGGPQGRGLGESPCSPAPCAGGCGLGASPASAAERLRSKVAISRQQSAPSLPPPGGAGGGPGEPPPATGRAWWESLHGDAQGPFVLRAPELRCDVCGGWGPTEADLVDRLLDRLSQVEGESFGGRDPWN